MSKLNQRPWITARNQRPGNGQLARTQSAHRALSASGGIRWPGVVRWLHLYLSVVSFALVLFFAITGFTLNHADWFDGATRTTDLKGQMNPGWVTGSDTNQVNKLALVEYLRSTHQLRGSVSEFRMDEHQVSVSFRGPGYSADIFIERPTGHYQLTETRMGLVAVLNDLHKGRDTGSGWAWVIDVSAVFMTLVSLTGLALLLALKKRRISGLWWLVAGAVVSGLGYWWLVA